ncbi:MAG: ADP-forming succinate--CoA ligase subunit beta [Pseudomonadota bacterium]|nr:ADP-forming succinate--CoA ligase subunit beta [Pseudomonadota bacterium]HJO35892.1 ADP-forming succinate--CoA ligase subunit beta [Gammaproteobacteria bacterium]
MNLHEYQSKQLFADYGIPIPQGAVADTPAAAQAAAERLGGERWVVKAQVHAGGRGKAGGVKLGDSPAAVASLAEQMLGSRIVTHQTDAQGLPVGEVLVEAGLSIERELYVSLLTDRAEECLVMMGSAAGGMDIEEVAASTPERIVTVPVSPAAGFQPYQARRLGFGMGLNKQQVGEFVEIMRGLYQLYTECDASLVEINPLIVTGEGRLLALDAKINLDDNALFRQPRIAEWRDPTQEDAREHEASEHDLNYVSLEGEIGCMVNGAGLAMATMDVIQLRGGRPANFLDVGGGATAERVTAAFKLILADDQVRAILVNIFGGIVRCDLIAEGIIAAVREVDVKVPVIVRLEGTNVAQGRQMLADSGLAITPADDLDDAARKAVAATAQGGAA